MTVYLVFTEHNDEGKRLLEVFRNRERADDYLKEFFDESRVFIEEWEVN